MRPLLALLKRLFSVVLLLPACALAQPVYAEIIEPTQQQLIQMTSDANKLLDRALIIGQASTLQREPLQTVAEDFHVTLQRWPQTSNIAVEAKLAWTALLIGSTYQSRVNDASSAALIYNAAIERWWMRNESDIAQHIANVLLQYSSILEGLQADKALQIYDRAILQYGRIPDLRIQAIVIHFFSVKGRLLIKLGRVNEGLAAFDSVQERYPNPIHATLVSAVANSNFAKADVLYSQLGRRDEATALLNTTLKRWDTRTETHVQETMTYALARLANNAYEQSLIAEALVLNEDLLRRASKLQIHSLIFSAISRIPLLLFDQKKYSESLNACDRFISLYDKATPLNAQYWVARTMLLKGENLYYLYRPQEAAKAYQETIDRFKSSPVPRVSLLLDEAEKGKQAAQGSALRMLRR
jgi:tetratricopeptide (TPR) repeat protein